MSFDICYQLKGDKYCSRVAKTMKDEGKAIEYASNINNFPPDTINVIVIAEEDGREVFNQLKSEKQSK